MPRFPPKNLAMLRGFSAGKVGWLSALSEWIDNGFDRLATRVSIVFDKGTLTVEDDGEGTATPQKIVQLGEHTDAAEGLAEFGMGGKESLLWAGGEKSTVAIVTTHRGVTRRLKMNWLDYAISDWDLPDAGVQSAQPGEIGTRIQVQSVQAKLPHNIDSLCEELGYLYSHAIRTYNKQITIKGPGIRQRPRIILPWHPPEWDLALPYVSGVPVHVGQKEAVVHAGVVKEGVPNPRYGLTYSYRYRVILKNSSKGCGDYHPGRVCGYVELQSGWKPSLTRNKNGLQIDDDALFAAVEQVMRPVLEAAEHVGSIFALKDLNHRLESRIASALKGPHADAKAKREKGELHGSVRPEGTPRRHKRAEQEQPGKTFQSADKRALNVKHIHLGGDKIGDAQPPNITLNLDNPYIAQAVAANADDVLMMAIASLIANYECEHTEEKGQRYLSGMAPKTFAEQLGSIVRAAPTLNGKPSLRAVS